MFLKLRQPFSAAPAQATMFKLAHISDPHLGPLPPVRVAELLNKRFFGWLSWVRRRRALHRPEVLARSEEHTSGLQSLLRTSYAVFILKKTKCVPRPQHTQRTTIHST